MESELFVINRWIAYFDEMWLVNRCHQTGEKTVWSSFVRLLATQPVCNVINDASLQPDAYKWSVLLCKCEDQLLPTLWGPKNTYKPVVPSKTNCLIQQKPVQGSPNDSNDSNVILQFCNTYVFLHSSTFNLFYFVKKYTKAYIIHIILQT